jgi:CheY-like chemotaxis protein
VKDAARILLVEDDPGIRETVAECLEFRGYAVSAVANGVEALAWLSREAPPELIVLDLSMPVMNGRELLKRVRADPRLRGVPAVLMTGAMPSRTPIPLAEAVLSKPFEFEDLLDTVARLARRRR